MLASAFTTTTTTTTALTPTWSEDINRKSIFVIAYVLCRASINKRRTGGPHWSARRLFAHVLIYIVHSILLATACCGGDWQTPMRVIGTRIGAAATLQGGARRTGAGGVVAARRFDALESFLTLGEAAHCEQLARAGRKNAQTSAGRDNV